MTPLWLNDATVPARLRLTPGLRFDTVVIGGGLTGLVTALLLAESGVEVAVVEGRRLGAGTTGATTGKISLLQGTRAQRIAARHSDRTVAEYVEANRAGQQWLLRYCEEHALPVQRLPALTYAQTEDEIPAVRAELRATRAAGLDTYPVDDLDVPFPFHGAVGLADQAQLDPMALLAMLAADVEAHAAPIFESTIAHGVHHRDNDDLVIDTEHGELAARTIIVATGTPMLDRGGFFARLTAQRSYLTAFRVAEPIRREMFISAGQPTRSLRYVPGRDGDLLLVGGNDHVVGRTGSTSRRVDDLAEWTRTWFPSAEPLQSWSAQDYHPIDELPYAGPLLPGRERILVATGYAKWGLTNGIAAALALAGRINGKPPRWSGALATWRPAEVKAIPSAAQTNSAVALRLSTGWLRMARSGYGPIPTEGCGRVERHGLQPTAVSTVDGKTTEVSAICPHLYGIVRWNDAEKSWDCPLHGSRFAADGTLLDGPATASLPLLSGPAVVPVTDPPRGGPSTVFPEKI
ncbi:FAD-dependent oxidoreductase [Nocardia sp. NPDC057440]|uniref:FAD-dependent oxidoreductase n=1 Tax=Nocardia sp. NPDC057440 TaxID=3346134 RepID=UPI00366B591C